MSIQRKQEIQQVNSEESSLQIDSARFYLAAGLSIIPIGENKRPAIIRGARLEWERFQSERPSARLIAEWFAIKDKAGIGIIAGAVSDNLEVLDFDDPASYVAWCEMMEEHAPGFLELLPVVETPKGGRHIYYRCIEIEGSRKLARRLLDAAEGADHARLRDGRWTILQTLIETKGEGGYVVAPGSPAHCHPSGKLYRVLAGSLGDIPSISAEQRDLMLGLACSLNEYVEPDRIITARATAADSRTGLRPGDDYNQRGDILSLLSTHGWHVGRQRGGAVNLRRPGKAEGCGATYNHKNSGLLYVFTSNAPPFVSERAYTPFTVYALLEHNGDFSTAAKALAQQGYGSSRQSGDGSERSTSPGKELTGRERIICRMLAEWGISDRVFRGYVGFRGLLGDRKTGYLSGELFGRHVRPRVEAEREETRYNNDKAYGCVLLNDMIEAFKGIFPVIRRIKPAEKPDREGNPGKPARYKRDETPFEEAEQLANEYLAEWKAGRPQFKEWEKFAYPIPGKTLERAAVEIAHKYKPAVEPLEKVIGHKKDIYKRERHLRDRFLKDAELLADVWEDMDCTTAEKLSYSIQLVQEACQRFAHKNPRKRGRKGQKSEGLTVVREPGGVRICLPGKNGHPASGDSLTCIDITYTGKREKSAPKAKQGAKCLTKGTGTSGVTQELPLEVTRAEVI